MSVNGKNDVMKRPVLPSVLRLANQICLDKIFWQNLILSGLDSASLNMENRWVCLDVCLCVT